MDNLCHPKDGASTKTGSSTSFDSATLSMLNEVHSLICQAALCEGTDRQNKVLEFKHPQQLKELLELHISDDAASKEDIMEICKKVIKYSVKTAHPYWCNQLYTGVDPYSLAASWITEALNTNQHTYEAAPVFSLVEQHMIQKMCSLVEFDDGDGMFFPGGTMGNMVGIHLARYHYDNNIKKSGMFTNQPLVIFTSQEGHYSIKTAANLLGFGLDNVVAVKTDGIGCILIQDLEEKVQLCLKENRIPCVLVATSGSTVLGAYDPLDECAVVCKKYGMWMHVDAAWGGGALVSKKHTHLCKGIKEADSVVWCLHKMLGVQLQCSAMLVKKKGFLLECNSLKADYLYQKDKFYDTSYDYGDMSIQCGRKADGFKSWLMWKAHGDLGMEARVDSAFSLARYMEERLKATEGFRLVLPDFQCTNVCFWYIPPRLRGQTESEEWWLEINQIAPRIKQCMMEEGSMMIGYQPLHCHGWKNFFRIIIANPLLTTSDIDYVISHIHDKGKDL